MEVSLQATNIKGLTPAINAVNSQDTFALGGKNYVFDAKGPKSAFGSSIPNGVPITDVANRRGFQTIRMANRLFHCTQGCIYEQEVSGAWTPRVVFPPFTQVGRWTYGFLNGVMFFCHPGIGVLYYNTRTEEVGFNNTPGLPSAPLAITVDNGRLIVLDSKTAYWSGPSNGFDFDPQLGGSGFQVVSDRVSGDPIGVTSYASGFITWTTQGMMRSEFTGDRVVYRHKGLNTEYRPINPFCIAKLDNETSIILDARGLLQSRGDSPTPYTPVFNEYLVEELKTFDSFVGANVRMEWDPFSQRIYISRSNSYAGDLYDSSYVLYAPLDKWGQFDFQHYGIGRGYWLDKDGQLRQFTGQSFMSVAPQDSTSHQYIPKREYPRLSERQRQTVVLGTSVRFSTNPESTDQGLHKPGFYAADLSAQTLETKDSLDSELYVGLFRSLHEQYADQMTQINHIAIGSVASRKLSLADVDYNLVPAGVSDEDYNVLLGVEDFGINPLTFVNFKLESIGSIDGQSVYSKKTPLLAKYAQSMRYFAGGANGIWHSLRLFADTPGEYFHLQSLLINGHPSGRIM